MVNLKKLKIFFFIVLLFAACNTKTLDEEPGEQKGNYVEISTTNPNYFQLSDGSPYIPVGLNLIHPWGDFETEEEALRHIEGMMKALSENGGNYVRIWLSQRFWDIEPHKAGVFEESKAKRIDKYIAMARKYGLRIKMTFEYFRVVDEKENPRTWAKNYVYHTSKGGPIHSVKEYLTTKKGHKLFTDKLDFYQKRYGSDTIFFGWELWNEMNAMHGPEDSAFFAWNKMMLSETKKRFPENLVMQSFGSFDRESGRENYKAMMTMKENDVAQIHRYLDLGAQMEVCRGPLDVAAADAIRELASYNPGRPKILAETGAVEPSHSGPNRHYKADTMGLILHDALFAPFFAGSAGAGMIWHWHQYVNTNNVWFQFGRFSNAIKGLNPIKENFQPVFSETDRVKIYELQGEMNHLYWLRDKKNTWKTELEEGLPPEPVTLSAEEISELLPTKYSSFEIYDPWEDKWSDVYTSPNIPGSVKFVRSFVVKVNL